VGLPIWLTTGNPLLEYNLLVLLSYVAGGAGAVAYAREIRVWRAGARRARLALCGAGGRARLGPRVRIHAVSLPFPALAPGAVHAVRAAGAPRVAPLRPHAHARVVARVGGALDPPRAHGPVSHALFRGRHGRADALRVRDGP